MIGTAIRVEGFRRKPADFEPRLAIRGDPKAMRRPVVPVAQIGSW